MLFRLAEVHLFKDIQDLRDSVQVGFFLGLHLAVPVVFDGIMGPTREILSDRGPFVAKSHHSQGQDPIFLIAPGILRDSFSEVVVPSLPALLSSAVFEMLGHFRPGLGSEHADHHHQHIVLLLSPYPFLDLPAPLLSDLLMLRRWHVLLGSPLPSVPSYLERRAEAGLLLEFSLHGWRLDLNLNIIEGREFKMPGS